VNATNRSLARVPAPVCSPASPALCPLLKTIRSRVRRRLLAVDEAILACGQPAVNGSIGIERLVRERAALVQTLELIVAASDRALGSQARRQWLEVLLNTAPACVSAKSRYRIGLLIEGLSD
jgi:hypothetical protein